MADGGSFDTFPRLLLRNAAQFGSRPAFRHKDLGIWQTWTWAQATEIVRAYAAGLQRLGLQPGDTIAIVGSNRPKLYWTMMAAQALRAIPVPVYSDAVADELAYVLAHADVKFVAAQDQEQVDKVLSVSDRVPHLHKIVYDEPRGLRDYDHSRLIAIHDVIEDGRAALAANAALGGQIDEIIRQGEGSDISIIIYTSGTTGASKGVMLSARGCIDAATDTVRFDRLTDNDVALAYLPLAWVGDHYLNYAQGLAAGFCMACPESRETIEQDLREIGPTFYFAPPRVFENMLTRMMICIEESREVQFRSPGMFVGYFMDQAKTAEALTSDGYVKTGDAGFFDEKTGHLKIIDRAKDVGRLADGTMFAPKYLENRLKFFPNIKEAVAYGDSREFVCAILNIDPAAVANWAERNNIAYGSYQELAGHPRVYDMVAKDVAEVNRSLAEEKVMAGAQIRRFLILHKELDADDGELTRTQKVRRGFIAERYAPLVTALYNGSHEADISTEVTFEDGRKGVIAARVKIRDLQTSGSTESLGKAA